MKLSFFFGWFLCVCVFVSIFYRLFLFCQGKWEKKNEKFFELCPMTSIRLHFFFPSAGAKKKRKNGTKMQILTHAHEKKIPN